MIDIISLIFGVGVIVLCYIILTWYMTGGLGRKFHYSEQILKVLIGATIVCIVVLFILYATSLMYG